MPRLNITPNIAYLKTPQAILKIVQIVTLLIAFSLITDCCDGGRPYYNARTTMINYFYVILKALKQKNMVEESELVNYSRNTSFFLAVTVFGWLLVVFLFTFFFLKLHERFKQINWDLVVMIISIVWSVLLLLCCSLMGNISSTVYSLRPKGTSTAGSNFVGGPSFGRRYADTMVAGVVFGFFSLIAFIVDAVLLFRQFWSKRKDGDNSSPNNPALTKVSESPGPSGGTAQHQAQQQIPPAQTREAPPEYDTVTTLPGQTVAYNTGQAVPYTAGQTVPYTAGQTVPYTAGQTLTNPAGQTMAVYPTGQQYQGASGQPVQMWQMA